MATGNISRRQRNFNVVEFDATAEYHMLEQNGLIPEDYQNACIGPKTDELDGLHCTVAVMFQFRLSAAKNGFALQYANLKTLRKDDDLLNRIYIYQ